MTLPFRTVRLLLPAGFKVVGLDAHPSQPSAILQDAAQLERKRPLPKAWQPALQPSPFRVSKPPGGSRPTADPRWPVQAAQLVSVHRMLGYDVALVRLFPVQCGQADGELRFSPKWDVTLTLSSAGDSTFFPYLARGQATARERLASWVDNPGLLAAYQPSPAPGSPELPAQWDYLLVTRAALAASFQPLIEQKKHAGLSPKLETMEAIIAFQPGRDVPEQLRNYIRHACTNWGVQYVLLGGDTTVVPCRYAYVPQRLPEKDCLVPSDLYFACLDGTWNRDNDNRWGEPTDGEDGGEVDLLAEVIVGRAPVDTPAEAAAFVAKILRHETVERTDAAGVLLLGAYLEQAAAQGGAMFDSLLPYLKPFDVRWLDDRPATAPRWAASDVLRELGRSPRLALYSGHADTDHMMRLSRAEVAALTNEHPFLVYSVGCNAGQFDNDAFSPDCLAEEMLKLGRHGAFAVLCNPRVGWYEPREVERFSGEFQARFFEQLLHQGQTNLGRASQLAKHELIGLVETSGRMPYRWCYYEITLLGDPHTSFQVPRAAQALAMPSGE